MEALLAPRWPCCDSAQRHFSTSYFPPRMEQRSWNESQNQHRFSLMVLQRGSVTSLLTPPSSSINEQKVRLVGLPALYVKRMPAEKYSLSRLNEELVRRTARAEKEPSEQDDDDKPRLTDAPDNQLWMNRVRTMQASAQIFGSTMFWIVLFFMASIWDGKNPIKKRPSGRGDRK